MSDPSSNPLSFKNLLAGIIVTVIGGVILAVIFQSGLSPSNGSDSAGSIANNVVTEPPVVDPIVTTAPLTDHACVNAPAKRLSVGANAVVCTQSDAVILRSGPHRAATSLDRLPPGTRLTVIGGPACDESVSWWYWEVQTESGVTGWVSEGGDEVDPYFVCPAQ
jgi:hypothetical protein